MSKSPDELAAEESLRDVAELRRAFIEDTPKQMQAAYQRATQQSARWIESSDSHTTLAAVFVVDCTASLLKDKAFREDKKHLLASLVMNDVQTLRRVKHLGKNLERILSLLEPFSGLSDEQLAELAEALRRP